MTPASAATTLQGITSGLKLLPQVRPEFLRDVLRMKRAAGHNDADQFKAFVCNEFGVGLNATIGGAAWAMRQWVAKSDKLMCAAFLADLEAVERGEWDHLFNQTKDAA